MEQGKGINGSRPTGKTVLDCKASTYIDGFVEGIASNANTPGISTGFKNLDAILDGGLYEGLYALGAISSLGKTTFAIQIADNIAQTGRDVLIFSLEMSRVEIMAKSISRYTLEHVMHTDPATGLKVEYAKTARGIMDGKRYKGYRDIEKQLINTAIEEYRKHAEKLYILEGVGDFGVETIRAKTEEFVRLTGRYPVVIVDYLQILAPYNPRATDKQNTDKAVLELKRISRDFKIPVIAISSFNRANYREAVSMESFKESGAIEYSSDVLIGLQLAGAGKSDFDPTIAKRRQVREVEAVILKNRNGQVGEIAKYKYYPMFNSFQEA